MLMIGDPAVKESTVEDLGVIAGTLARLEEVGSRIDLRVKSL